MARNLTLDLSTSLLINNNDQFIWIKDIISRKPVLALHWVIQYLPQCGFTISGDNYELHAMTYMNPFGKKFMEIRLRKKYLKMFWITKIEKTIQYKGTETWINFKNIIINNT